METNPEMNHNIYRLIVVDDEAIIREGITRKMPWFDNGFDLTGTFENGLEVLEYVKTNPVDVVISDINMPRMDGLTLSQELAKHYPHITVLLLTGYDDFEYAQEAVKNQVREFLLKPITADELGVVLKSVREELDGTHKKIREQELMKEKLEQSFPLLRERFLNRLALGKISGEILTRRGEYTGWQNGYGFYQFILIHIPDSWDEIDIISLSEYMKQNINEDDELFSNKDEELVLLLQDNNGDRLRTRAYEIAKKAFLRASHLEKKQIMVGCGEVVDETKRLSSSYRGAQNVVEYSRVMGISQILSIEELRDKDYISLEEFNNITRILIARLTEGSRGETRKALEEVFNYLEDHFLTQTELPFYFTRLHYLLYNFIQDMDLFTSRKPFFLYSKQALSSISNAREFFGEMLEEIEDKIHARRHDLVLSRIDKARKIIKKEYSDSSFSLQKICNSLYLSSSQFSLIFKEGTGQTFVEFLTSFRIEEAKKLLKNSDLKGYEIAEKVGYTDPRYFTLIFKKSTGMTAMEYRKSIES